eukprot:TRINITY_DN15261_c0_g2_i1.p1 TRINITY_DN15261_c0_g2~~TRINITY_DN15261_c0_g2_i1.p1  ORF type:complete len:674 (-),score=34.98 TRINITY_DN15261_c0_g2_i1:28-2049(-)
MHSVETDLGALRFRKPATDTAWCPARRDGTTMASRIKHTARVAWCNPWIRCLLAAVAMVSFPVMASVRTSDLDVDTEVKSESQWRFWPTAPSPPVACPGSFKFQLPHDTIEVPRLNVRGVLQETLYTFTIAPGQRLLPMDSEYEHGSVLLTSSSMMHGQFHRWQHLPQGEGRNTTGLVTWQPFDQTGPALFGGPDNRIKWGVAEKWHGIRTDRRTTTSTTRPFENPPQGTQTSSWLSSGMNSGMKLILRYRKGFGKLMDWWDRPGGDPWLRALLFYMIFTDLGQQVVHVGFDRDLVNEGRQFAEDNAGIPDESMKKRVRELSDDLEKTVSARPELKKGRLPEAMIGSSGVSCLHFEPPQNRPSFRNETRCKGFDVTCKRRTDLPLKRKLFMYSGQTTLWPDTRLGTLSGVAYLDVKPQPHTKGQLILSVFVSIGTFASMPPSMFVEKVFTPRPVFYVGTLDHTSPKQRRTGIEDCRQNPLDKHNIIKRTGMQWSSKIAFEILAGKAARPSMKRERVCNPCYSNTSFIPCSEEAYTIMHEFADTRARGKDPLENQTGKDALGKVMHTLEESFKCSGSYLWTPGRDRPVSLADSLAWAHFMMETPDNSKVEKDFLKNTEYDSKYGHANANISDLEARKRAGHRFGSTVDALMRPWAEGKCTSHSVQDPVPECVDP